MAMTYKEYIAANRLKPTAATALAWLKSGQAPVGTPIPASLRQHFGGQGSLRPDTPGVDYPESITGYSPWTLANAPPLTLAPGTFTPPPAAPTPPATDINPTPTAGDPYTFQSPQNPYLPEIAALLQQFQLSPQLYNPQRQALAASTAAQLGASGLVDFQPGQSDYTTVAGTSPEGNVTYGVVQGPDGRAYLQAFAGTQHGFASRGVYSGSVVDAQQTEARRALDTQRQQLLNQLQSGQQAVNMEQFNQMTGVANQIRSLYGQGQEAVRQRVSGWQVPQSYTFQQQAAQQPTTVDPYAVTRQAQPQSGPSPLTQMSGGQRTVTGAAGPSSKVSGAITGAGQSLWNAAKTRGVTTKSTQLMR